MTFTVSTFATFGSAYVSRSDGITTVDELSTIITYFELDLPTDSNCRFRINFPSDMPVTVDIASVVGSDLFGSTTSYVTIDTTNNYLELDGCTSYSESGSAGLL